MLTIKEGDRGEDVRRLQHLLNTSFKPSPGLGVTGVFDGATRNAVLEAQRRRGLKPDGIVGPMTWNALNQMARAGESLTTTAMRALVVPWMEVAIAELGVSENTLAGKHNERIVEYHSTTKLKATTDETPWCSSFVNWVMRQACYPGTDNALAKSWLNWGTKLTKPKIGAITVIKSKAASGNVATGSSTGYHVGFYVSSTATHIRLLGGNQGNRVKYSDFARSAYNIEGYRWP